MLDHTGSGSNGLWCAEPSLLQVPKDSTRLHAHSLQARLENSPLVVIGHSIARACSHPRFRRSMQAMLAPKTRGSLLALPLAKHLSSNLGSRPTSSCWQPVQPAEEPRSEPWLGIMSSTGLSLPRCDVTLDMPKDGGIPELIPSKQEESTPPSPSSSICISALDLGTPARLVLASLRLIPMSSRV